MKNDELKEIITQAHMAGQHCADPDIGNASYSDAFAYFSTRTEPKEQDVCPECDWIKLDKPNGFKGVMPSIATGKAPVDKIREAFENINYDFVGSLPEQFAFQWFSKGYKSQQAEIERLKAENEAMKCCGNCRSWEIDDCIYTVGSGYMCDDWQSKENN